MVGVIEGSGHDFLLGYRFCGSGVFGRVFIIILARTRKMYFF
jgi:hypothetical protein